jgi:hypothetical protein
MCDDVRALLSGEIVCWRNAKRHGGIRHCAAAVCLMPLIVLLIVVEVLLAAVMAFFGMLIYGLADFFAGLVWFSTGCFCGDPKYPLSPCEYRSIEVKMGQISHGATTGSSGGYIAREAGPWEVIPGCECSTLCCEHVVQPPPHAPPPPPVEGHTTTGAAGTIASLRQVVVHPVAAPLPLPSAPPHERMEGQS